MKAAICREFGAPLSIEEIELDPPGRGEVRLRVAACSICHSDISFMKGYWGRQPPFLLGHEIAGVVEEAGPEAAGLAPGDRVVATLVKSCGNCPSCERDLEVLCETPPPSGGGPRDAGGKPVPALMNTGGFAEAVVVHHRQCIAIPDDLPFDTASLLGCGVITGFGAATRVGKVQAGESVGVVGVGGVGVNALIAARIAGAASIIAIDTAAAREGLFREMGATGYIDPAGGNAVGDALRANGGKGLDIVLVATGAPGAVEDAVDMARPGGRVVVMGMPKDGDLARIDLMRLANEAKTIAGTKMGAAMIREDIPRLIGLHRAGEYNLDRLVSHRYPFAEINTAIETAMAPDSARVVVEFGIG